jgi:hypothetical protein
MSGNGTANQAPPATARRRVLSIALWVLQVLLPLSSLAATAPTRTSWTPSRTREGERWLVT